MLRQKQRIRVGGLLLAVWAAAALGALIAYWALWMPNQLDADMASEQVLAHLLAQSPGLSVLSTDWCYSTELRVLNTQLVMAPLFRLLDNWHLVRVLGSLILMLLYLAAWFFFARHAGLRRGGLLGAVLLLLPLGPLYCQYVLAGLYYIPHIAITFFSLGCLFWALQRRGPVQIAAVVLLCLVAFGAGLGGPRQLFVLYLPLTLAVGALAYLYCPRDRRGSRSLPLAMTSPYGPATVFAVAADLCAALGYLINALVLSKTYLFETQDYLAYSSLSLTRIQDLLAAWLAAFGWEQGSVFSLRTLFNLLALAFLVASIWVSVRLAVVRGIPSQHRIVGALYLAAAACFVFLYAFTNSGYSERYLLPLTVLAIPLLECWRMDLAPRGRAVLICGALLLVMTLRGGLTYAGAAGETNPNLATTQFLLENGYTQGYASFWDGNVMTELSNGNIEVWTLGQNTVPELRAWLQVKEHLEHPPEGKVFFVISKWEAWGERQPTTQGLADAMPESALIYEDEDHKIYGFESDAAMREACGFSAF